MSEIENSDIMSALMAKIKPKDEADATEAETETNLEKTPDVEVEAETEERHQGDDTVDAADSGEEDVESKAPPKSSDFARMRAQKEHAQKKEREASDRLDKIEQLLSTVGVTQSQMAQLLQAQQQAAKPKVEAAQEPNIDYEPEAWKQWYMQKQAEESKARDDKLKEMEKVIYKGKLKEGLQTLESDFIEETPDYADALNYLTKSYSNSIRMMNPSYSKYQIKAMVEDYRLSQAAEVFDQGINPAQYFYEQAKEFGYSGEEDTSRSWSKSRETQEEKKSAPNLDKLRDIKGRAKNTINGGKNNHTGTPRKESYSIFDLASMPKSKAREVIFND